jgi:hypothetical protein
MFRQLVRDVGGQLQGLLRKPQRRLHRLRLAAGLRLVQQRAAAVRGD